jgi:hypothetical protein
MKKIFLIPILLSFALIAFVSASQPIVSSLFSPSNTVNFTSTSSQGIVITQLSYSPYPANPGEYFDLYVEAQAIGALNPSNATFILNPSYPFSLTPGDSGVRSFGQLGSTPVIMHFQVLVDQNAVAGNNELDMDYSPNGGLTGTWGVQPFQIQTANAETDFDLVVQASSSTGTSIGIANIGENTANSLIVRIPTQSGFRVSGTNGQIVGNLNSGDYTLATFDIIPTTARGNQTTFSRNSTATNQMLQVELDYTDAIGVRRSVIKDVAFNSLSLSSNFTTLTGNFVGGNFSRTSSSNSSIFNSPWFWIILIVVLGSGGIITFKVVSNKKKHKHSDGHSEEILDKLKIKKLKENSKEPDWVSSERKKK